MGVNVHWQVVVQVPPDLVAKRERHPADVLTVDVVPICAGSALILLESVVCAAADERLDARPGSNVSGVEALADGALHH